MSGYVISDLSSKTQKLIKEKNLDVNGNGKIDDDADNNELARLLSETGAKDINELQYDSWFDAKKEELYVSGLFGLGAAAMGHATYQFRPTISRADLSHRANELFKKYNGERPRPVSLEVSRDIAKLDPKALKQLEEMDAIMGSDLVDYAKKQQVELQATFDRNRELEIQRRKAWNKKCAEWKPKVSMKNCLQKSLKEQKLGLLFKSPVALITSVLAIGAIGAAAYLAFKEPGNDKVRYVKDEQQYTPTESTNEWENKYKSGYEKLGITGPLKEYTPQKDEYWTAILQAKYGVDEKTAREMAHTIKGMIYDNPKAAKQSPIMYLPETWNFNGKTYNYTDSHEPIKKADSRSDEVKTEMGKMSKDLEY